MAKSKPFTIAEIRALIPRFAATALRLEWLMHKFEGGKADAAVKAKATNGRRGPRRKRRGGAGSDKIQEKLLGVLKGAKGGLQLGVVVKKTGLDAGAVKYHLRKLRASKQVRVSGTRRDARWAAAK